MRILVSFAFIKMFSDTIKMVDRALVEGCEVFIDSGAFSNFSQGKEVVTIGEYCSFLEEYSERIWRYINFDVLGDAVKTQENYEYLRGLGFNPVPVLTYGNSIRQVQEFLIDKEFFCVGNIARSHSSVKDSSLYQYQTIGVDLGKSHLLGISNPRLIWKYKPYSFDLSTHLMCGINGKKLIFNPLTLESEQVGSDDYEHYIGSFYEGVDDWVVSSCESIRFCKMAEKWGSRMFFVCSRMRDYDVLRWGEELYLKNVA